MSSHRGIVFVCLTLWAALAAGSSPGNASPPGGAEMLILYDASSLETPESIVFDRRDNAYITLALTGEVRKISPDLSQSTVAVLPIEAPCGTVPTLILGLAIDRRDRVYVAVNACNPANQGIWRIDTRHGGVEHIVQPPAQTVFAGLDVRGRYLYAADTFDGMVWRAQKQGGIPEIWIDDPLLDANEEAHFPGPNGLEVFRGEVYVANSSTGHIIAIPILPGGAAGPARIYATLPDGQACDEFTFDVRGSLYCATSFFNTIVRIDRDGTSEVLLTEDDLLDGPTSVAFGRRGSNRKNLYITNAAYPFFSETFRPSLMRTRVSVPGAP